MQISEISTGRTSISFEPGLFSLSADRKYIVTLGNSKQILQVLELATNKTVFQKKIEELAKDLIIDPSRSSQYKTFDNKKRLLLELLRGKFAIHDSKIYFLFEGGSGVVLWQLTRNEVGFVLNDLTFGAAWSQRGKYIATKDRFNRVNIIDVETKKVINRIQNDGKGYSNLTFSPDEKYLAVVSRSNTTRILESSTGKEIKRLEDEYVDRIDSVAFSPNGKQLATISSLDKNNSQHIYNVKLWSLNTQSLVHGMCSRLLRNLRSGEWKNLFDELPYQKTCPNLPLPEDLLASFSKVEEPAKPAKSSEIRLHL